MIRVLLIDLESQRILMHIHIIPDLLSILMFNIGRRLLGWRCRHWRPNWRPVIAVISVVRLVIGSSHHGVGIIAGIVGTRAVVGGRVDWRGMRRIKVVGWVWGWRIRWIGSKSIVVRLRKRRI